MIGVLFVFNETDGFPFHCLYCSQSWKRLYGPGAPKRITGLIVQNETVRVPKYFKRALKQEIYCCQRCGVLTHLENINSNHFIHYREYLYGKAYYVRMIETDTGEAFLQSLDKIEWPKSLIG